MTTKNALLGTSMALILGSTAPLAQADGVFEYNPSGFGGTNGTFTGDELTGQFSTAFTSTDAFASFAAEGWFKVNTINLNHTAQPTGGLDTNDINNGVGAYDLWFEYTYTGSGGPGGVLAPNYDIDSVSFELYAGSGSDRDFNVANGALPSVVTNSGTNTLIGTSDSVLGGGVVNFSTQSFSAVDTNFEIQNMGTFFTAPNPFFDLAFQSSSTVTPDLDFVAGTGDLTGTAEIRFGSVPEPTSLALMGLGLLALGWTASRRRQAS